MNYVLTTAILLILMGIILILLDPKRINMFVSNPIIASLPILLILCLMTFVFPVLISSISLEILLVPIVIIGIIAFFLLKVLTIIQLLTLTAIILLILLAAYNDKLVFEGDVFNK